MDTLPLLILLVILAAGFIGVLIFQRSRREGAGRPAQAAAESATIDMQTQDQNGATVASLPEEPEPPAPLYRRRSARIVLAGLLALLALAGGTYVYSAWAARSPERFVVLVAPFADGGDGQTGRNVASELARLLDELTHGAITAAVAPASPATPQAALELATAEGADLLIWGTVEPGSMLDSPTLSPRLIYNPTGPYAPNGWAGYMGRFAMPRSDPLTREPINGRAVLAPLVVALYDYSRGQPDLAATQLDRLLQDYPALSQALPRALRGNILWARGFSTEAANEYRLALAEPSDEQALLANNLGAILLDAGDPAALTALAEAVRLLDGRDLGELRANLGSLALREQRPHDAAVELEQARNLTPDSTPLLLDLAAAYRDSGRLDEAAATLEAASAQKRSDARLVPPAYRVMFNQRSEAAIAEQQALLSLARQLEAQGPVVWELEAARPLPADRIRPIRDQLSVAADTSQLEVAQWRRSAASESAALPGTDLVATGQAEQAERQVERQRYYQALIGAELERGGSQARDFFSALFSFGGSASPSLGILQPLLQVEPNNPALHQAIGRTQRLLGQLDAADQSYDRAISLAPQQPEGYFGKGMVAHDRGDPRRAAELYGQAIDRNGAFFPARVALSRLAEEGGDWPAAIAQRRALNETRPAPQSAVALAQALRHGGQAGWQEAEQILIPLSATSADAAIELGRLYNDAGRPEAAINAYNDALAIDRRSSTAAFELGETLARQGDYAAAERSLRDALSFDKTNIDAQLALADLYQGPLDKPSLADRAYREALAQGVRDPARLEAIGDAASTNRNVDQAIKAYSEALKWRPDDPNLHFKLGTAYQARGRREAAAEEQRRVIALSENPATPELAALRASALVALGDLARGGGNLAEANSYYGQALQIDGNRVPAQIGLGLSAVGQGNWGVAHGYFETAARLPGGAENPEAQFWLAESLLRRGDYVGATEHYQVALEQKKNFPEAYLGLAQTQYAQGNRDAALATVAIGLGQRPDYAEALLFKGKLLQEAGRFDEALAAYNRSIDANGSIAETQFRRGVLHIQKDNYDQAISDLSRAARLQPNFPEAAYWLGRAYYAQGRLDPALTAFRDAIRYNGNFAEAIFYSGLVAEDLGRTAEAISAYQTVLQIDSRSDLAARARAQLDRLT
ncbi:MAG: tetratricopeptide repeat protein [Chloroflexales bacterium]|nr:tetratricopeptide repeat protein [Chloroflexales bacterium]